MQKQTNRLYGEDKSYLKLYELSNGFQFASRKAVPVVDGNGVADAVVVIAHDSQGRLLVIKEFRPCVNNFIWSFPAGLVDEGETICQAAYRETFEECGLRLMTTPESFRCYTNTYSSAGMTDEKIAIVNGTVYGELSTEYQEKSEKIIPYLLSADDMVKYGLYDGGTPLCSRLATYLLG